MKRKPLPAKSRLAAFIELTKPRITVLILISTALGYYLGENDAINYLNFFYTIFGTALLSGGAGAINHYIEKDLDVLMDRTKSRPIPAGLITSETALYFGIIQSLIGVIMLWLFVNTLTAILGLATITLYLFVYTPLKKITWLNTTVGAIPGAMPTLGGWAASANELSPNAWVLFAILFFWQHPHFYAIAFIYKDDYDKAGLKMLSGLNNGVKKTALHIFLHALVLIPISTLPFFFEVSGRIYFVGAYLLSNVYMLCCLPFILEQSRENARLIFKTSIYYFPLLFFLILADLFI